MEVWRFPGIGFSLCAVPTFNCIQGILDRGYELSFQKVPEWRKCTRMIPSTSMRISEMEVQSRRVWKYMEVWDAPEENRAYMWREESSRARWIQVEFDIQNAETYMTQGT